MNARIREKNRRSWNDYAQAYAQHNHAPGMLEPILDNPAHAFPPGVWAILRQGLPELGGLSVCVPSSGDNLAVFAFALLGAQVTSCDIAENQLTHARSAAESMGILDRISFVRTDTMALEGIPDGSFDLVYTSNGVHVWMDDLPGMYRSIHRVMKPGAVYLMYDVHPFQRPFNRDAQIVRPYDATGPHEDEYNVNFSWRIQDILNAMLDAGLKLTHMEELFAQKDYESPFGFPMNRWYRALVLPAKQWIGCMIGAKIPWPPCRPGCAWPPESHKEKRMGHTPSFFCHAL